MSKISQRDALRTTTMFLCDSNIEAYYDNLLNTQVASLKGTLSSIGTVEGLKQYIRTEKKAISLLFSALVGKSLRESFLGFDYLKDIPLILSGLLLHSERR